MSPYPPTQAQEIDKLKCASIEHVSDIILQVPTMSSSLISALEISQLDLDAKQLVQWRTAFENEKQRYPQHAWELLDALIRKSIEVGGTLMAILGNCDYQEMARGFRVCHARAEILRGGSGRKLAGKIAMRALRYPIANYWVFTEEPLCEILKHEHPLGFEVEGGYLPWVPAWVLAVLESDVQNHDVGAQAVFERLLSSGADVEEDIPGGHTRRRWRVGFDVGNPGPGTGQLQG